MSIGLHSGGHRSWNQPITWTRAPQPHDPDASEYTWTERDGIGSSDVQFQSWWEHFHHCRSALAEAFTWMKWCGALTVISSVKNCYKNVLPGLTTVAACDRWPMRDSKSLLVQDLLGSHLSSNACRQLSLSEANLNSDACVSIKIPRNVTHVAGPSVIWVATGMPRCWKTLVISERFAVASDVAGAPRIKRHQGSGVGSGPLGNGTPMRLH